MGEDLQFLIQDLLNAVDTIITLEAVAEGHVVDKTPQ